MDKNSIQAIKNKIKLAQRESYVSYPTILTLDDYLFLLEKIESIEKQITEKESQTC